jgi:hypothetical protein
VSNCYHVTQTDENKYKYKYKWTKYLISITHYHRLPISAQWKGIVVCDLALYKYKVNQLIRYAPCEITLLSKLVTVFWKHITCSIHQLCGISYLSAFNEHEDNSSKKNLEKHVTNFIAIHFPTPVLLISFLWCKLVVAMINQNLLF